MTKVAISEKPTPTLKDIYEKELVAKRHNCTDIICLIIFIIFGLVQAIMSLVIFIKGGDPSSILLPHDSSGNKCTGSTPNLFYFNLASCISISALSGTCPSPTICVQTCPNTNLFYLIDSHRTILFNNYCQKSQLNSYFNGNVPSSVDSTTYFALANKQICPTYALESTAFYSRCLPSIISSVVNGVTNALVANDTSTNQTFSITDLTGNPISDQTISTAAKYVINLLNLKTIGKKCFLIFLIS